MSNYTNSLMVSGEFEKCWKADLIGSGTGRSGNPQHAAAQSPLHTPHIQRSRCGQSPAEITPDQASCSDSPAKGQRLCDRWMSVGFKRC
ncbi:hypothetical protein SRHO_G00275640 [Serrasalmus rhombeus]